MVLKKRHLISGLVFVLAHSQAIFAQNPKIKCYFNHTVNTAVSSGVNAIYLNSTFDDTIAAYINRAKYTVDIAQYDFTSSSSSGVKVIATAANNAHARGVVIRWIYNGSSSNSGLSLLNSGISTLGSPTSSSYGIMHNKFVAIDANSSTTTDPILITASYDWSDEQTTQDYNNMVIVQDKPFTLAYYNEFNKMWGGTGSTPNTTNSKFGTNKTASATTTFTVNGTVIEVYFSPKDGAGTQLQNNVASANNDLHFGIYTFTDNTVATAIKNKYAAGVAGFGIMDTYSTSYSPYTTLSTPMGSNLKIYNGGSSSIYHNKMMIIDALHPSSDPRVVTGSFNWTNAAETSNDENMIVIHDATIANEYYQSICKNFADMGGTACAALTTGISEYDYGQQAFAVYPNPVVDVLQVQVKQPGGSVHVTVSDMMGKTCQEMHAAGTDHLDLDLHDLSKGMYLVRIDCGDRSFVQKIIK